MGSSLSRSRPQQLSDAEEARLGKKCRSLSAAYTRCLKANPGAAEAAACANLETSLVMCLAGDVCKAESDAHQRCYMSLMNTGRYNGKRDCNDTVAAMKACLARHRLYPFSYE